MVLGDVLKFKERHSNRIKRWIDRIGITISSQRIGLTDTGVIATIPELDDLRRRLENQEQEMRSQQQYQQMMQSAPIWIGPVDSSSSSASTLSTSSSSALGSIASSIYRIR